MSALNDIANLARTIAAAYPETATKLRYEARIIDDVKKAGGISLSIETAGKTEKFDLLSDARRNWQLWKTNCDQWHQKISDLALACRAELPELSLKSR